LILIQKVPAKHALIPMGIGTALSLFGDSTLYTVLPNPDIATQVGVSLAMVGVLLGANRFARLLFNGLVGALFDRLPRRPLMITAMCLGTLATICYALGRGPAVMLLGRVFWGAAWSGIWIGGNAIALDISNDSNRGAITGRLQMWFSLGLALTSFTGGLFTDLFTYRGGLWVSAGLGVLGFLTWLFFLPETRPNSHQRPATSEGSKGFYFSFPWKDAIISGLPLFAVRFSFHGILNSTTILWLSRYIENGITVGGITLLLATFTGLVSAARILVGTASAPLLGALSDLGKRRWVVLALLFLAGAIGMVLMGLPWLGISLIGALFAALTSGTVPAISAALVGDKVSPEQQSRGLGLIYTFGDLGATLGPVIALTLVPIIGIPKVYLIGAGMYTIIMVQAAVMALTRMRQEKSLA